jgi:hypothetical protein
MIHREAACLGWTPAYGTAVELQVLEVFALTSHQSVQGCIAHHAYILTMVVPL